MPTRIGGFTLQERLGAGSMGQVFKATQVSMARTVALKVIPDQLATNTVFTQRFLAEARAAGKLVDPHVVMCYDVGQADGFWYMALEYVRGGDAAQLASSQGGKLSETRALEIVRDCAKGLRAIQAAGLIHRDIKPANILIGDSGIAKLGDLGLARGNDEEEGVIAHGGTVGTPAYISPEQAGGVALDIRSDIYSLCATLYRLVTGQAPFSGETVWDVVALVINERVPDPRTAHPGVSDRVAAIIRMGTSKDPAQRYQDPMDLKADIDCVLQGRDPAVAMRPLPLSAKSARSLRSPEQPRTMARAPVATPPLRSARREEPAVPAKPRLSRWLRLSLTATGALALVIVLALLVQYLIGSRRQAEEITARHEEARAAVAKDAAAIEMVRPGDAIRPASAPVHAQAPSTTAAGSADQADPDSERIASVRMTMRPEEQIAQVVADLRRLNSDYDGKIDFEAKDGQITDVTLSTLTVSRLAPLATLKKLRSLRLCGEGPDNKGNLDNLSPLRSLSLARLDVSNNTILDLSPIASVPLTTLICRSNIIKKLTALHGMKIVHLDLSGNIIADIGPLSGMPLQSLSLVHNQIRDIVGLAGLKLTSLDLSQNPIHDISTLKGMPLERLAMLGCEVQDVSALAGLPLRHLLLSPGLVSDGLPALRALQGLETIDDHWSEEVERAADFWTRVDDGEFTAKAQGDQPLDVGKGANVLVNGTFDSRIGKRLVGWVTSPGCRVLAENGQHYLRLTAAKPSASIECSRSLVLKPGWSSLTVSVRMRAKDLHPGTSAGASGRLLLWYASKAGDRVGAWPEPPLIDADGDWAVQRCEIAIPTGADRLMLSCQLYLATGTVDFADITVQPH
jgi:serine/threonine-protein kinase